jgi:hypothetical protein
LSRLATSFVLAYHGCDDQIAQNALSRRKLPIPSNRDYDWLGPGIYFWEADPRRAVEWARDRVSRGEIKSPAVIGAVIDPGNCLDLTTRENLTMLRLAYEAFYKVQAAAGVAMPVNRSPRGAVDPDRPLRYLDCAVIRHLHRINDTNPATRFDTARGMFPEGDDLYPGAGFKAKNHIQIAVRTMDCIKGFFLPPLDAWHE